MRHPKIDIDIEFFPLSLDACLPVGRGEGLPCGVKKYTPRGKGEGVTSPIGSPPARRLCCNPILMVAAGFSLRATH